MIYVVLKHISIVLKIHMYFILNRNFQTVSFAMLGHFIIRVITWRMTVALAALLGPGYALAAVRALGLFHKATLL